MSGKLTRRAFLCRVASLAWGAVISSRAVAKPSSESQAKHIVRKGDTVSGIARKYGVKPAEIIEVNKLKNPDEISPGQELIIPRAGTSASGTTKQPSGAGGTHIVQKGETIWGIAKKYGVKPEEIIKANKLKNADEISPGQELIIPGLVSSRAQEQKIAALCRLPRGVRARRWRYIIIHHSGTNVGNAASFGRYHRRLGMRNGLAYHFVIGNGKGAGNGEIEVGGRWRKQLQGGHVRSRRMNEIGIGICLVGNFEKTYPTKKEMESLVSLVKYLIRRYNIPKRRVLGHRDVNSTDCPGKNFSLTLLRRKL